MLFPRAAPNAGLVEPSICVHNFRDTAYARVMRVPLLLRTFAAKPLETFSHRSVSPPGAKQATKLDSACPSPISRMPIGSSDGGKIVWVQTKSQARRVWLETAQLNACHAKAYNAVAAPSDRMF